MQESLVAGDTLAFDTAAPLDSSGNSYKASDGWSMSYVLVPRSSGGGVITFSGTADGDDFAIEVAATTTAGWESGWYTYSGYVSKAGTRYTFDTGQIEIRPDPASVAAGYDGRSVAVKTLEQLKAAFQTYSSSQGMVAEYEIAGRRMKFRSSADLLDAIRYWSRIVADEQAAERVAAGQSSGRKVYTRFMT